MVGQTRLLACILVATLMPSTCQSAFIFQGIPGAQFMRDLSYSTLDNLNNFVDGSFDSIKEKLNSYVPLAEPSSLCEESHVGCAPNDPDTGRNVSEMIRARGFQVQEYDVITDDGYILTCQRIINPLIKAEHRSSLKPVILQHGLLSSSVDWVINSVNVRPAPFPDTLEPLTSTSTLASVSQPIASTAASIEHLQAMKWLPAQRESSLADSQQHPNSLGFYLANEGYDVFLANSRGNTYARRHVNLSTWEPKFWDFSFDQQIAYDLPAVIDFVQQLTGHRKFGYVGHSQGTAMMFGLLADRPEYADVVEPFVALAPVAHVSHAKTPAKYFSFYTPVLEHVNMAFATSNAAIRYLGPIVCGPLVVRRDICANIVFLGTGFNEEELDDPRVSAYLSHIPAGTSVKNLAHYGQEMLSGRFAHFDHGILGNKMRYGQETAPDYNLARIRSKNIILFHADNDWLASPKDIVILKEELGVKPMASFNITEEMPKWNHIDFVYGKHAGLVVNTKIVAMMKKFDTSIRMQQI